MQLPTALRPAPPRLLSGSLLIRTVSFVMRLWKMLVSIAEVGSFQLNQLLSGVHARRSGGCRASLPPTFSQAP